MSRAKYLTLITWLGQSAAARRFFFVFSFVVAATAQAPVLRSPKIAGGPDAAAVKKPDEPIDWPADPQKIQDRISLMHPNAADPLADAPLVLRDTYDFKPISPWHDLQSPAPQPASIAIANDPPTAQPVAQFFPVDGTDAGLVSREFDAGNVGFVDFGGEPGAGFTVSDPIATAGSPRGTPAVGTAVPEPTCVWLLPAATILLRHRKITCA